METNFNFKSAICTSREQSERLLALGLKKETADMVYQYLNQWDGWYLHPLDEEEGIIHTEIPAWSLHRLIELTRLKVTIFMYGVVIEHPQWRENFARNANAWDNLCDAIEWLIKEGYFNKEYLV